MTLFYLDASAWLKRYFLEPGSGWMMRTADEELLAVAQQTGLAVENTATATSP